EEPPKQAKSKSFRRDDAPKDDVAADKKSTKAKPFTSLEGQEGRGSKRAMTSIAKTSSTREVKTTEPVVVAALAAWAPLEISSLTNIKEILPLGNHPQRVGLHTIEAGQHYFEMYDLKK